MRGRSLILTTAVALHAGPVHAEAIPFDSPKWQITARESEVTEHLGRPALKLKGGGAWLSDSEFTNGRIEFDIAFGPERGFMGAMWRRQGPGEFEEFYVRPHQSGNPDANQYTPVFHGVSAWQLYYGEGYAAPVEYKFNQWLPVRIVVAGGQAEIFLGDMEMPALFIPELKRPVHAGQVGVTAGDFAPGFYSNFRFTSVPSQKLMSRGSAAAPPQPGTVRAWWVSRSFPEAALDSVLQAGIPAEDAGAWTRLESEPTGITNLARVQGIGDGRNAVIARIRVTSNRARVVPLRLGYSDRATVFLNGTRLYAGDNTYLSRDYRYLGTIGLFDTVYLPLALGDNDMRVVVVESFGGWGLMARFDDLQGIAVK